MSASSRCGPRCGSLVVAGLGAFIHASFVIRKSSRSVPFTSEFTIALRLQLRFECPASDFSAFFPPLLFTFDRFRRSSASVELRPAALIARSRSIPSPVCRSSARLGAMGWTGPSWRQIAPSAWETAAPRPSTLFATATCAPRPALPRSIARHVLGPRTRSRRTSSRLSVGPAVRPASSETASRRCSPAAGVLPTIAVVSLTSQHLHAAKVRALLRPYLFRVS